MLKEREEMVRGEEKVKGLQRKCDSESGYQ
jgi:hypothetical protein